MMDPIVIPVPTAMECHRCGWSVLVDWMETAGVIALCVGLIICGFVALYCVGLIVGKVIQAGYERGRLPRAEVRE